jgi:hypothetical protein
MITSLLQLLTLFDTWFRVTLVNEKLKPSTYRPWFFPSIGLTEAITASSILKLEDRTKLNATFTSRYSNQNVASVQANSHLKAEISALYSFHKCAAARSKTRLNYYRDDLCHKGGRMMNATGISYGRHYQYREDTLT